MLWVSHRYHQNQDKIKHKTKKKKEKRKKDTIKHTRNILFSSDVIEGDYVEVRTVTREVSFQGLDFIGCLSQRKTRSG